MLESFWNSLELEDLSALNYYTMTPYPSHEHKQRVVEKLDWLVLRLYKIRENRRYDYDMVITMKDRIGSGEYSLTERGIEFLNRLVTDFQDTDF